MIYPKQYYNTAKHTNILKANADALAECIRNGTSLPKGHGRLIDEDDLIREMVDYCVAYIDIQDAPTIIEADKEQEE